MFLINSALSQFEVTNLIGIFAQILDQFNAKTISIFNDAPQPWQFGFQDSAAPGFTGLVTLHNTIGFYLIIVCFAVFWAFFSLIYYYSSNNNPIAQKYLTHGTVLELI